MALILLDVAELPSTQPTEPQNGDSYYDASRQVWRYWSTLVGTDMPIDFPVSFMQQAKWVDVN